MGFRDDVEAAQARAEALEREKAELERANADLQGQVSALEARLAGREKKAREAPEPAWAGLTEPADPGLMRAAYRATIVQVAIAAAFLLVVWGAHARVLPGGGGPVVVGLLAILGGAYLAATGVALWHGARPIAEASGYDRDVMRFTVWFWVPFVLLMPVAGTIMGIARVVILLRGTLSGGTIKTNGASSQTYPAVRLTGREGWPAAFVFLCLTVAWPAMVASAASTGMGMPRAPSPAEIGAPFSWAAVATTVDGDAPVAQGAGCQILVESSWGSYNCRVTVDCGSTRLYGGPGLGYTSCQVEGGRPVGANDPRDTAEEGDPRLLLDAHARTLVVSDSAPRSYSVTLTWAAGGP